MTRILLLSLFATISCSTIAQFDLQRYDQIPVTIDGEQIRNPWVGGHNFCQFSNIDLDQDGTQDLFAFDRTGNWVTCYIQEGAIGETDLVHTTEFDSVYPFPELHDWVLMVDYNCDGKQDIYTYSVGGIAVYKNTSNLMDGLQFELVEDLVYSNYVPSVANLFITSSDLPAIVDVDNDGDMDVLTFSILGSYVDYHKNMSMENYGTCDSLEYQVHNRCWGYFSESINTNSVNLLDSCSSNVENAEMPLIIEEYTQELRTGGKESDLLEQYFQKSAHSGSTLLSLDTDADGVKELILGDVSYDNLVLLNNGGEVDNGLMLSQDTAFPIYDVPVDVHIFPGAFYVDVNNDQVRDLLVSPNNRNLSENFESIWYYQNLGTDDFPDFELQRRNFLQHQAIDAGEGANPVFFDANGDGLDDLLLSNHGYYQEGGNYPSMVAYFQNIGTAQVPEYELVTRDYQDLSLIGLGQSIHPTFGDIDGDGDLDMFVGEVQGKIHYFENNPVGTEASFTLTTPNFPDDEGNTIDIGQFATPQLVDLNRDQLLDLIIGERNGNINYFENTGTSNVPVFKMIEDTLGGVVVAEWWNITGYASPVMYENQDGEYELLVGSEAGYVWHFDDIDGNLGGTFHFVDSLFQGIDVRYRSHVAVQDFDNDGLLDLLVGNYRAGLTPYKNFTVGIGESNRPARLNVVPNPATDQVFVDLSLFNNDPVQVEMFNVLGGLVKSEKFIASTRYSFNASQLSKGHYTIVFRSADRSAVAAFIKD